MAKSRRQPAPFRVLFIGNSFTARNDLPGLTARLAAARNRSVEHRLISAGGASLRRHWNAGAAARAIRDGRFDVVVLQEQSTLPVKNAARMRESVRLFDGIIRAAGAKTALYMTWARQHAPATQSAITAAYSEIGREIGAIIVPVGRAWQKIISEPDAPALYDKDGSHPTVAGSYLAACVFLAVLLQENPVGIGDGGTGLSDDDQRVLQRAAWQTVRRVREA